MCSHFYSISENYSFLQNVYLHKISYTLKPETIDLAGNVAGKISQSISAQPTSTHAPQKTGGDSSTNTPLNSSTPSAPASGNDGFSHTERLKNF